MDAISIVVGNALHRPIAEAAIAAGKHVLCEKPLAGSMDDARAMVAAEQSADVVTAVGYTFRRSPAIAAIRDHVQDRELGEPTLFDGRYWCDYACDPRGPLSWRFRGGPGSGALADIGAHVIDAGQFVCGPIVSVSGAVLSTQIPERPLPLGAVVGHTAIEMHPHNLVFSPVTLRRLVDTIGATNIGAEMDPSHLMWQGMDVVACIRDLGPLVFHAAAKGAMITPGVDIRGVLGTLFERVPADAPGKVPTGYGFWCNAWPENPGWRFVAVGVGHDADYWPAFLRALAEVDPDMAVHEDAAYDRLEGLALAAGNLRAAAEKL